MEKLPRKMPKFEFVWLIFLIFIIKLSSQLDCELCYDGRIDATFSYEDQLVLFKGKSVYVYKTREVARQRTLRLDIEKVDISVYGKLLDNKTFELVFYHQIAFSEFCSEGLAGLKFDRIQTAFYDQPNQRVVLIEGSSFFVNFSKLIQLKI